MTSTKNYTDQHYRLHHFEHPFSTESGFTFDEPVIAYRTWGTLNRTRSNVVLICHALTGNPDADAWFHGFFGEDGFLDPQRHYIVCANVPGSCYGSTGPWSENPRTGKPYRGDFPEITIRDLVRFQQRFLDALDINSVQMVIGGSMGGMQALEFTIMDSRARSAVIIAAGKDHSPWAIGLSHTQRQAIFADPKWNGGFYEREDRPESGLAIARRIAMLSYRCPGDVQEKFGRKKQDQDAHNRYKVESYLDYQGQKLADRFDALSYVRLSGAMDSHDVARNRIGSAREILGGITIPILVIGIDSDLLYPVREQHKLAKLLPGARYREIRSHHGHDAFLIEFGQMNSIIKSFLTEIPTGKYRNTNVSYSRT